ncbi:hypothetical protein ACHAXT_009559 [Thalassiosira profunda]
MAAQARGGLSTVWIVVLNSVVLLTLQQLLQLSSSTGTFAITSADGAPALLAGSPSPFGMTIPQGEAVALPSVPTTEEEEASIKREFYGGKGDKAHLGGFTSFDPMGVSPTLWTHMISHLGIRSLLDLGCGRGISTSWFITHGLEYVVCAEGSHDAVTQSLLPQIKDVPNRTTYEIVEHDFSRGPWWPSRTVDVSWCVEFTEHVGRNYMKNYHTAFHKAALIFVTHSHWGGWHHVEVHGSDWWQTKMESMGYVYSDSLTKQMKQLAGSDKHRKDLVAEMISNPKNRTTFGVGQHLWTTLQVFINPMVASLPEHQHLFAEHGCFRSGELKNQECGAAGVGQGVSNLTPLPESFKPLPITKEMDDQWLELIKDLPLA